MRLYFKMYTYSIVLESDRVLTILYDLIGIVACKYLINFLDRLSPTVIHHAVSHVRS